MNRKELLEEALRCVTERGALYGRPEDVFEDISVMWSAYLGLPVSTHDVALMMIIFKVARARENPDHLDNFVDIAGYAACASECLEKTKD